MPFIMYIHGLILQYVPKKWSSQYTVWEATLLGQTVYKLLKKSNRVVVVSYIKRLQKLNTGGGLPS